MSPKTKAASAIVVTLCIGVLIGALGHGAYLSSQDKKVRTTPPSQFFVADLERTIQPDEKQKDAIAKILAIRSSQIAAIMERHLQEIGTVIDSTQSDLLPILNEEQRRRMKERLERGMIGPPRMMTRGPQVEMMKMRLGLSDEQAKKIQRLFEESQEEIKRNFEAHRNDPDAVSDSMAAIMLGVETKIKSILTPEQQKKFENLRKEPFMFPQNGFVPPKGAKE